MKYQGKNYAYFETRVLGLSDKHLIETSEESELMILWFQTDNNVMLIDGAEYVFNKDSILCLTEFHQVEIKTFGKAKLIKWNKLFYCIINHDSEVGCKGILFYGAVKLPIIHPSPNDVDELSNTWKNIEKENEPRDSLQEEMLESMLKRILILCTRIYKNQIDVQEIENDKMDIIREYHFLVEQHFLEKHTVAEYAEMLFKSPKTLSNIFNKLGSKPPLQFIIDRRMLEARRLLSYSDLTITEVAYKLGFADVQSFSRFFKRQEGVSPANYKK